MSGGIFADLILAALLGSAAYFLAKSTKDHDPSEDAIGDVPHLPCELVVPGNAGGDSGNRPSTTVTHTNTGNASHDHCADGTSL